MLLTNSLFVFWNFVKAIFFFESGNKKNLPLYLSGKNLFFKSFRLPDYERKGSRIFFKQYVRILKSSFKKNRKIKNFENGSNHWIFDSNLDFPDERKRYVEFFSRYPVGAVIGKNGLSFLPPGSVIIFHLLFFLLIPWLVVKKDKVAVSLILSEFLEALNLLDILQKNQVKELFYFCIYEKDSNITSVILMQKGFKIVKIPSEVPLSFWNSIIICDKLCVCNSYQYDEIKFHKSSMIFDSTEMWGPEQLLNVFNLYTSPGLPLSENTLGYYSTAAWVREKEGHLDQGVNMYKNETLLKKYLKEYLHKNRDKQLVIYLHPKEKTPKYFDEAKRRYDEIFSGLSYKFASYQKSSSASFNEVNIAIAFNTTLMYERLYFGFKCILMPLDSVVFPLENSSIKNICAFSKEELFEKINLNLPISNEEFFKQNNMDTYPYFWRLNKDVRNIDILQ